MFFASLIMAGIELVCAAGVFALARTRTVLGFLIASLAGFVGLALVAMSPVLFLLGIVLAAIGIVCAIAKARHTVFVVCAIVATLILLGGTGWLGVVSWSGLKARYPFESISARLAYEAEATNRATTDAPAAGLLASSVLSESTLARLSEAEENQRRSWNRRSDALRLLHSSYVEQFVESPGFGVGRMIRPTPYSIEYGDRRGPLRVAVDRRPDLDGSAEPGTAIGTDEPRSDSSELGEPLAELHRDARADFLDPDAFGYFRDRDHVAGFIAHGFSNQVWLVAGQARQRWLTVRLELVSILRHEQPKVYISEHLPNMAELRDVPVRPLDAFEQQALASLAEGEDLVSDVRTGRIRALGSLRAMRQCLECHQVERGTLLGAFSYEFLRDPPLRQQKSETTTDAEKLL